MKRLFVLAAVLAPVAAFAIDTSDCETIGYWQSVSTTCEMYDDCVASVKAHQEDTDKNPDVACAGYPRSQEECAAKIARENAASAEKDLLIKCPMNDARLAHKNAPKTSTVGFVDGRFVEMDGVTEIEIDDMISDSEFVYYTSLRSPFDMPGTLRAFGPRDAVDGLYLSVAE